MLMCSGWRDDFTPKKITLSLTELCSLTEQTLKRGKKTECDWVCTLILHWDTVVSSYPFLCVDATGYFLPISSSFPLPSWLPLLAWLFGLTFGNTWVYACELGSSLVWETRKAAQSHLLGMQTCPGNMEVPGTKELLSHTALTEQLTKSHQPRFASSSDIWRNSRVSPKSKLLVLLCDVIG